MRIVTLTPSATEIVCVLGLHDQLVGVTHECDFPASVIGLPTVTRSLLPKDASSAEIDRMVSEQLATEPSLYALDAERLAQLRPDLIVTQSLCDVCAVAESAVQAAQRVIDSAPRVITLNPTTLDDVLTSIREVASAANVADRGELVIGELRLRIEQVAKQTQHRPPVRMALLEWLDPPFAAGHWNPTLVRLAGGLDVLGAEDKKSRRVDWTEIAAADPEAIVVACCGYDAGRAQQDVERLQGKPEWEGLSAVRAGRVHVFNGNAYFNRPGPRLVDGLKLMAKALRSADCASYE